MPIVASIGGNTGNQTMALVIRALALDRIQAPARTRLVQQGADHQPAERCRVGERRSGSVACVLYSQRGAGRW